MLKFHQLLNLPRPLFNAEGGGSGSGDGGDGQDGDDEGGIDFFDDSEGKPADKPSRFDGKGALSQFRSKDEGEEADGEDGAKGEGQEEDGKQKGDRPEWLPEKFKTPEALASAYANLEKKLRDGGKKDPDDIVPDEPTAENYFGADFKLDPEVKNLGLESDDPGLSVAAAAFAKHGIGTKTAASIVREVFKGMDAHAPTPIDPEQEFKSLGNNGQAVIDANYSWLNKMDQEGRLSDDDANIAVDLMNTARGVRFLNKMRSMAGERSIPLGAHVPAGGNMSPEEWQAEHGKAIAEGNHKRREELERMGSAVHGNNRGGAVRISLD